MFYLSLLPPKAQHVGKAIHVPESMAILCHWSLNLLNQETSFNRSTRQKARRASMDEAYMLMVLEASIP